MSGYEDQSHRFVITGEDPEQTFSRNTRMFGVVALRDDRRLVVTGRVRVGAQGQVGTGSSGIHGRPSSASRRTVTMLRPCLAAVDA